MKQVFSFLILLLFISSVLSQDNLFWIGGSGSWNDPDHWSLESGGTPAGLTPNEITDVFFDENSFSGIADSVSIDTDWGVNGFCNNMYWEPGVNTQPVFIGNENTNLFITGSMHLSINMDYQFEGVINFNSIYGNPLQTDTIQTSGNILLNNVLFDGINGSWILTSDLTTGNSIYLIHGSLNTNGKQLECGSFISDYQNARTLNIQNSTINLLDDEQYAWITDGTNLSLIADNSQIFVDGDNATFKTQNGPLQAFADIFLMGLLDSIENSDNQVSFEKIFMNGHVGSIDGDFIADSIFISNENCELKGISEIGVVITDSAQTLIQGSHHIERLLANNMLHINGSNYINYGKFFRDCLFLGENTFDTLILFPGEMGNWFHFESGKTQTIMDSLFIRGNYCTNLSIYSTNPQEMAYIRKDYGEHNVSCDFLIISNVAALSDSINFYAGNNSTAVPDPNNPPHDWIFENDPSYIYGFGGSNINPCIGDTLVLDASCFNGDDFTQYYWNGSTTPGGITYEVTETSQVTITVQYFEDCYVVDHIDVVFDSCENSIRKNLLNSKVKIYPNPSDGIFTLEIEDNIKYIEFSLWSLKGAMFYNEKIRSIGRVTTRSFDFSYLKKGIYYARIMVDHSIITKKVIIR